MRTERDGELHLLRALSSPDSEKAILGAILTSPDLYFVAAPLLRLEDFSMDSHRRIYASMAALAGAGKPVGFIALIEELSSAHELERVGDKAYVSSKEGRNISSPQRHHRNRARYDG